jgi:uncharacterized protein GlcG (DUF336 family)
MRVVSCRVSDWRGKADVEALQSLLPFPKRSNEPSEEQEPDEALLGPIFNPKTKPARNVAIQAEPDPSELRVVQIAGLTQGQKGLLAAAGGVVDTKAFLAAIDISGLEAMTDRPGDLVDVIGYWVENNRLGTLAEMTEEGAKRKLREDDAFRVDAGVLSTTKARQGAELLAAALAFGKTFTVKAAGQESDPGLAAGALDAAELLQGWTQLEVNALLRRGLFAPATYGRIRFHHRSTQEYLAARWLNALLEANCPQEEIRRLLFVELYGVATVPPALRPVAAWLALWQPAIREEIIVREPVLVGDNYLGRSTTTILAG